MEKRERGGGLPKNINLTTIEVELDAKVIVDLLANANYSNITVSSIMDDSSSRGGGTYNLGGAMAPPILLNLFVILYRNKLGPCTYSTCLDWVESGVFSSVFSSFFFFSPAHEQ